MTFILITHNTHYYNGNRMILTKITNNVIIFGEKY